MEQDNSKEKAVVYFNTHPPKELPQCPVADVVSHVSLWNYVSHVSWWHYRDEIMNAYLAGLKDGRNEPK